MLAGDVVFWSTLLTQMIAQECGVECKDKPGRLKVSSCAPNERKLCVIIIGSDGKALML